MSQGYSRKIFGRLLADYASNLINSCSVSVTSRAAPVNVYRLRNDYALYEVSGDGVDTVGVWGSNPHAPIIFISVFQMSNLRNGKSRRTESSGSVRGRSDAWTRRKLLRQARLNLRSGMGLQGHLGCGYSRCFGLLRVCSLYGAFCPRRAWLYES
jgi:hypothetical protein